MPAARFGRASAIISALLRGNLRDQFYSDVFHFGESQDATRQVALGYICLASCFGWIFGAASSLIAYPAHPESCLLAVLAASLNWHLFGYIRRRKDPRSALDYMIPIYLLIIVAVQYRHTGFVAPMVATMPLVAGVTAMYQRRQMHPVSLTLGIMVAVFCLFSATGMIGEPPTADPRSRSIMTFITLLASTFGLAGISWMSTLSRDYRVDQLKAANDAIVENVGRVRAALDAARVGLWDVPDVTQRDFSVSENFQSITGYSAEEFNGIFGNVENFVHPDDVDALRKAFAAGREDMSRIRIDFRLMTRTRGYRWFSARARYTQNANGVSRLTGSLQDINVLKVAEETLRMGRDQARAADKAKSDFIAVMSHEVRTPLNAILGSVEVLKRAQHDSESREMIDLIDDAGRGLLTIVNDLLDVSRIDAGKMEIQAEPTDIALLVRRTAEFWGPQARNKGLTLNIDCSEAEGAPPLMLDAGRIRQIVGNLVSNAVKFTDTGTVSIHLSFRTLPDDTVEIGISVIDSGPGVPDAIAEAIFVAFEQGPSNASRGGTGLGLFISRRLARMMGGDLTLEPARRNGAHFRLTLPVDRANTAPAAGAIDSGQQAGWEGVRLLCVDDNERNRRIIELLLGKLGFDVTLCASGSEALDLCAIQAFDLILMDIIMPDMSGVETLGHLRSSAEGLNRTTPAIALTARVGRDDAEAYLAAGFDGVSAKPINLADLSREIARVIPART